MGALDYLGNVKTPTRQIAAEVHAHLEKIGKPLPVYSDMGSQVIWGYNAGGAEHGTGRALDFMVQRPGPVGEAVVDYVWANRERFGLIHIIWKQRIKSTRTSPGVWRGMSDRGSPTENHMDHPHCYFDGRAIKGGVKVPTGSSSGGGGSSTYYQPTGTKLSVKQIQRIVGVTADGYYGADTKAAVKKYQRKLGVTADGLWGKNTQAAHDKGGKPASKPKPSTSKAPKFPLRSGHYFGPKSGPASSVSGYYSHRADLKRWQAQMRKRGWSITADGLYGPATKKVARQFQQERGLGVDGLIGKKTWDAAWNAKVT